MNAKEFFNKICSRFLLLNLLAMVIVVLLLCVGVGYGLDLYTHHGEGIEVPELKGMRYQKAYLLLQEKGLNIVVSDSGYNKTMPADCILAQMPGHGQKVKEGHIVYVTVNSPSSPTFAIPDIVDNSSLREAEAKLTAMGFRLAPTQRVTGEKDWVYGILCRGRRVTAGEMVSIDLPLTLMIGSGEYDSDEIELDYIEPEYRLGGEDEAELGGGSYKEKDDFEEVKEATGQ